VIVIDDTVVLLSVLTRVLYYGVIVENYRFVRGRDDPSGIPFLAIKHYTFLAVLEKQNKDKFSFNIKTNRQLIFKFAIVFQSISK